MEYSKMALPHVFESFGSENMMEPIETPLITDEMHILSDTFFSQFEFDDKFPLQDWCLPEDVEEETEVLSHTQSILRHDCMWRGSCADEDHEFSYLRFMRKKSQNTVKAVYNKSKLKSLSKIEKRKNTSSCCNKKTIKKILNMKQDDYNCQTSDGELPCSPPDSDSDCDDEIPSFKHEINIDEQLSECFSEFGELFSVSDVTGQSIVYPADSNKCYYDGINIPKEQVKYDIQTTDEEDDEEEDEEEEEEDSDENEVKQFEEQAKNIIQQNTLNDHCYYSQDVNSKKLDNLGVQTPSDSEEEIDVVTLEKPCKPSLPTHPSPAEQKTFQRTVNNALVKPAPRPRGRPPLNSNNNNNNNNVNVNNNNVNIINNNNNNNNNIININTINANAINTVNNYNNNKITNDSNVNCRKRVTQEQKQNKKAKTPYQRKPKAEKKAQTKLPITQQQSMNSYEKMDSYSEEEPETDKRNQHNNMERQRRVELKDSFEFLRSLVPDLKELDKAPKVKILNTSAKYCEQLEVIFDELDYEKRELERTQLTLRERISKLRQHLSEIYFSRAQQ